MRMLSGLSLLACAQNMPQFSVGFILLNLPHGYISVSSSSNRGSLICDYLSAGYVYMCINLSAFVSVGVHACDAIGFYELEKGCGAVLYTFPSTLK